VQLPIGVAGYHAPPLLHQRAAVGGRECWAVLLLGQQRQLVSVKDCRVMSAWSQEDSSRQRMRQYCVGDEEGGTAAVSGRPTAAGHQEL
jgi:hypothetical protein